MVAIMEDSSTVNLWKTRLHYEDDLLKYAVRKIWRQEWQPYDSLVYSYYPDGQLYKRDHYTMYHWNDGITEYSESYEFDYTEKGSIDKIYHRRSYDSLTQSFKGNNISGYSYHPDGSTSETLYFNAKDGEITNDPPFVQEVNDYDFDIPATEVRYPRYNYNGRFEHTVNSQLISTKIYDDIDDWKPVTLRYHYSSIDDTSSEELVPDNPHIIFPNPASDYFTLSGTSDSVGNGYGTLDLYDTGGQRVLRVLDVPMGTRIDISGLDAGLYYYKISMGEKIQSGALVKVE